MTTPTAARTFPPAPFDTRTAAEQFERVAPAYVPLRGRLHVFGSGEQHFVMPGADDERVQRTPAGLELALHDALAELERQRRRCLVVVAEAGGGKTTFLQALCAEAVQAGGLLDGRPLVYAEAASVLVPGSTERSDFSGQGYVLLDGFDRIAPEAARREAVRALETLMTSMPEARFVVAARPSSLSSEWLNDRFLEVRVCALNGAERDRLVVRRFAVEASGQAGAQADAVKQHLREVGVRPTGAFLARNPLVVSALCRQYLRGGVMLEAEWAAACSLMADEVIDQSSSMAGVQEALRQLDGWERRGDAFPVKRDGAVQSERGEIPLALVRGGAFRMGSPSEEPGRWGDEGPVHEVEVSDFYLAPFAVTNWQYAHYLADHPPAEPPPHWGDPAFAGPDHPVVGVAWEEARRFAVWAGCRLPTEAEWEYACRAGSDAPRYGDLEQTCWYRGNSGAALHPVGRKDPNAGGLYDMLGNAWEWVEDDFHPGFAGAPDDGTAWCDEPRRTNHVLRGGSWADAPHVLRAATRLNDHPGPRIANVGFRLARSPVAGRSVNPLL